MKKKARFEKLKSLRMEICEKESLRQKNNTQKKSILQKIGELKRMSECADCTMDKIRKEIKILFFEFSNSGVGEGNEQW